MNLQELYEGIKATIEVDPELSNESVMLGMRSLKGCRQRCLLDIDSIDMHGKTIILLAEDRD